jgi:hypothetical protein
MKLMNFRFLVCFSYLLMHTPAFAQTSDTENVEGALPSDALVTNKSVGSGAATDTPDAVAQPRYKQPRSGRANPFAVTDWVAKQANSGFGDNSTFVRAMGAARLPKIVLRGIITSESGSSALIEVGQEGTFTVRPNESISLYSGKDNTVLRIVSITKNSVTVEVGTLDGSGQIVLIR